MEMGGTCGIGGGAKMKGAGIERKRAEPKGNGRDLWNRGRSQNETGGDSPSPPHATGSAGPRSVATKRKHGQSACAATGHQQCGDDDGGDDDDGYGGVGGEGKRPPRRHKRSRHQRVSGERHVPPPKKRNAGVSFGADHFAEAECYVESGLRRVRPYRFDFTSYCKGRWLGRTLGEVLASEFRAQGPRYYEAACAAGRITLNGERTSLAVVLRDNDLVRHTVHRHEPPVAAGPVTLLAQTDELVVVDKPSSMPVHPCGRYRHNTVIFVLGKEHGLAPLHTVHRLDRLTSGVLLFAHTLEAVQRLDRQIREREVQKEYLCRVEGRFPGGKGEESEEVVCAEPVLVVSYSVGVCRVDPRGKPCRTTFTRLSYNGRSSVLLCRPETGRMHQIRVHLQFLGHPIINDPVYNAAAWGPARARGGTIGKSDEQLLQDLLADRRRLGEEVTESCDGDGGCGGIGNGEGSIVVGGITCSGNDDTAQKSSGGSGGGDGGGTNEPVTTSSEAEDPWAGGQDPLCSECRQTRPDPRPDQLIMFLHALRYRGPGWEYTAPAPEWASADWQEPPRPDTKKSDGEPGQNETPASTTTTITTPGQTDALGFT
ncbi:unnamed protein product [Lampetra planeri]